MPIISQVGKTLIFATNDTERLRITSAGNIGVGTDNPDATLKVNVASGNNGLVVQNGINRKYCSLWCSKW